MKLSGYPTMPVLKTTSPAVETGAPKLFPVSLVPSLRRSSACIGGILEGVEGESKLLFIFGGDVDIFVAHGQI